MTDYSRMFNVSIVGSGIYETLYMPVVPRKGDILWLSSLTMGRSKVREVLVSKVEWARDQTNAFGELDGIHARITVRRTQVAALDGEPKDRQTTPNLCDHAALDVERLARALTTDAVRRYVAEAWVENGVSEPGYATADEMAAAIAREYAALDGEPR
jgi:hypothetical protein